MRFGLTRRFDSSFQIRAFLRQWKIDRSQEVLDRLIRPRGIVTCGINASPLFSRGDDLDCDSRGIFARLRGVGVSQFAIRHSITVSRILPRPSSDFV